MRTNDQKDLQLKLDELALAILISNPLSTAELSIDILIKETHGNKMV